MRLICLLCCLTLPFASLAAEPAKAPPAPPPAEAPPPPPIPGGEAPPPETGLEPEVTITTRGDATFEEYRINGRLYMIKVTPKQGRPYYLLDREGRGEFERGEFNPKISIPQWVIKSW